MKEYLLLFWNESGDGQYQIKPEEMEASMEAWQSWIGHIAMQGKLISTKPIVWDGTMVKQSETINKPAIVGGQMVTGYMLCKATDKSEVQQWANSCPISTLHKGFTEIREIAAFEL